MSTATIQQGAGVRNCRARVQEHLHGRIADIRQLWDAYQQGEDSEVYKTTSEKLGDFSDYGLSFDYVAPSTFSDQRRGYFRYQLSWGGPSDEFRFFCDERKNAVRIEYWFLDWNDGAKKILYGKNLELMTEIFDFFREIGTVDAGYEKATQ